MLTQGCSTIKHHKFYCVDHTELKRLFILYMEGKLTSEEYEKLSEAAQTHTINDWQEALAPLIKNTEASEPFDKQEWEDIIQHILKKPLVKPAQTISINRMLRRIAVAASILLVTGTGGYFLFFKMGGKQTEIEKINEAGDVRAPEINRAMITLADGRKVYMDNADSGTLAIQGNIKLVKLPSRQIAYQTETGEVVTEVKYNTLENPRGSKVVDMILSDGSHLWLNAGSSITYPVAFIGNERRVTITGEAYFEVANDKAKPFFVSKGDMQVRVLGTHFNANAYDDEAAIKVTLLEGSVKVIKGPSSSILVPGQQARITSDIRTINDVDLDEVMSWKNGKFSFGEAADIETIMKQIARWYDVDVEYKGTITEHIGGTISRNVNVSKVLEMLEMTGIVKFQVNGKKIIVMPQKK